VIDCAGLAIAELLLNGKQGLFNGVTMLVDHLLKVDNEGVEEP
jgi:hypothetical protein